MLLLNNDIVMSVTVGDGLVEPAKAKARPLCSHPCNGLVVPAVPLLMGPIAKTVKTLDSKINLLPVV